VSDPVDARHREILPERVWGDGDPEGVSERAAEEMKRTARAAARLGIGVVTGFTGSPIWHLLYRFPPTPEAMIDEGFERFAAQWTPILDVFEEEGVQFGLEVHPTEIAFDSVTARRALAALDGHAAFGFNYDPSHLAYQGVDYVGFNERFPERIVHAHAKDVWWSASPRASGVFGGHLAFGDAERQWDFRSLGRGRVDFDRIVRALNRIGYDGPLSVEWEDAGMDRERGAEESCAYVKRIDFMPAGAAFDDAFSG
jgi:sugar phosphate isomerase/epimerase